MTGALPLVVAWWSGRTSARGSRRTGGCDETSCVNAVECLLLGDQAANLRADGGVAAQPAGHYGDARIGAGPAVREALRGGYDSAGWRPRSRG